MKGIARILIGVSILVLAARVSAEERWRLKFEHETPRKILVPPHVPPGLDFYFGQKAYWYVLYKITNISVKKRIENGNPITQKEFTGPRMCMKIWVETDANRRLVRPFIPEKLKGVEAMEGETEKKDYPRYDEVGGRATWGSSRSLPLPPFIGTGACFMDGFFPIVHDYIAERHGYRPKFNPSLRFKKGPNAALPTLADCFDINEPLDPGESRTGCAIFCNFPVSEYGLFYDAVNLLSVFAEERRNEAKTEGFIKLRKYRELFPEGRFIKEAQDLLNMENVSRGSTAREDPIIQKIEWIFQEMKGSMDLFQSENYAGFAREIDLLTKAAKKIQAFKIEEALENLETFRQKYKKSELFRDADLLYMLAKRNLIPRARMEAAEILKKNEAKSIPDEADRIYIKVSGLRDPVLREGNLVYANEPVLVIMYHRRGDASFRSFQSLRCVEERWIPGKRRPLHKIARTRIGEY